MLAAHSEIPSSRRWSHGQRDAAFDARLHRVCSELLEMADAIEDYRDREEPANGARESWLMALEAALSTARAAQRCMEAT